MSALGPWVKEENLGHVRRDEAGRLAAWVNIHAHWFAMNKASETRGGQAGNLAEGMCLADAALVELGALS